MSSEFCKLLNIKYPIIQGPMAWIADANLASAVSNAGGLGVIAAGNAPVEVVRAEIIKAKQLTDKPFGVNIMMLSPFADEISELVCEENVKIVTTGAGNPQKYIENWKQNNIKIITVIASVSLAKMMQKVGVDAVIAEGMEAGGHIGRLTTMCLVPQVVDAVNIPVIAAGGIADGRGMAAAFMLGAKGVQIGTRFLTAYECTVHQNFKNKVLKAKDLDTTITGQFTGHPVRLLRNKATRLMLEMEERKATIEEFEMFNSGSLKAAAKDGDLELGSFMCGQIAGLVTKEQSCKDIITEITDEYKTIIANKSIF